MAGKFIYKTDTGAITNGAPVPKEEKINTGINVTPEPIQVGDGAVSPEPKAPTTNSDAALLTSVSRGVALGAKNSPELLKLFKQIPAAKIAQYVGKFGARNAGTIVNSLIAAGETYLDAKSGKLDQNGNYLQNAGNSFSAYLDSVLFNVPELVSKKVLNTTPYWENTPEKTQEIQQTQGNVDSKQGTVKAMGGANVIQKSSMEDEQAKAKAVGIYIAKVRKTNPKYSVEEFYATHTYNPKTKIFMINK